MGFEIIFENLKETTDYVSIISLITSIISLIISTIVSKKINRQNLNAVYFNKIFDSILIDELPKSLEKIRYINSTFVDDNDSLENTITNLYDKITFFKYKNLKFYKLLEAKIIIVDDFLVQYHGFMCTQREFKKFKDEIDSSVREIYYLIEKEYCK